MIFSIFRMIFIIYFVDCLTIEQQSQDNNPFTDDESKNKFILIPSIGYEMKDTPGKFNLIMSGWYYKSLKPSMIKSIFKAAFKATLHIFDTDDEESDSERIKAFFVKDVKDHNIQLKLSESLVERVSTDKNGQFYSKVIVDSLDQLNIRGDVLTYIAFDEDDRERGHGGSIYLMKNKDHGGCSIISDIDDTIKISEVPDKKQLIINTFKKPFRAVPGMSDVYRSWVTSHKCLIHYVSAMPSQLYYATQKFLDENKFPSGSFHMRHLKSADSDKLNLIDSLFDFIKPDASRKHKLAVIENILTNAPIKQQFIMVGDSGELDPEVYGEIARNYPLRIKMIFIRVVEGGKNDNNRFQIAFQNVPLHKWRLFSNASVISKKLFKQQNDDEKDSPYYAELNNSSILSVSMFVISLTLFFSVINNN